MTEARIRELTKTMLRKKLYVVLSKGGAAPEKIAEHLPRHLEYMIGLEKKGVLFASGPSAEADGKTRGDGLTVLRAASAQAAREIAEADPFIVHGLRSFELREWTVMEGSLGIKVHFPTSRSSWLKLCERALWALALSFVSGMRCSVEPPWSTLSALARFKA